jgi:hypothetical protein
MKGKVRRVRRSVMLADEMEGQESAVLAVMEYYDAEMTREEYVLTNYLGAVTPEEDITAAVEATFPEQFRRKTLLDTQPASDRAQ